MLNTVESRPFRLDRVSGHDAFTPQLTLQGFVQAFIASVHFDEFTTYTGIGREIRLDDLEPTIAPADSPDFEQGVLNATIVLRWEYRLGSTLFLVYSRAQAPELSLSDGEDARLNLSAIGRGPAVDVFLAKLSYWWE